MRRNSQTKRRFLLGAFGVAVAPLVLASVAHACTQLTNLAVNPKSGAAGVSVELTGSNYRNEATAGPVEIRLNSRSGPVIASLPVSAINATGRTIRLSAPIPANIAVVYHTLIATQINTATGALLGGFPVRAAYRVTAPATGRTSASAPAPEASTEPAATAGATEPAALAASPAATPAVLGSAGSTDAAPSGAAGGSATPAPAVAAPANDPAGPVASAADSVESPAPRAPVADVGRSPVEAAALSPAAAPSARISTETVSGGLLTAPADATSGVLPGLTLALGAALVLLSLAAFLKSGRTALVGRRPTSLA